MDVSYLVVRLLYVEAARLQIRPTFIFKSTIIINAKWQWW